jgi:hypothetical protein
METSTGDWVEAGPFRAHLRHLMVVGGLDEQEAATVTGLPVRAVQHILHGRGGRAQRRISPDTAHRLLRVGTAEVVALRWCLAPAVAAQTAYGQLRAAGWSALQVATAVQVPVKEVEALTGTDRCPRLLVVRLVSQARRLAGAEDDRNLDEPHRAA